MAFLPLLAMVALASSSVLSSHPSESARNQYEAGENKPQPQPLTEATDHPEVQLHLLKNSPQSISDLQVGYGDGFIQEKSQPSEAEKQPPKRRRRRSFTPWSGQVVYAMPYESINIWKPPIYQLSRPYYIPIYGVAGRPPIFFPPQPLLINPGVPKNNPKFQGPQYLPPAKPTVESTTMKVGDRFNGGDNEDDRPVWGSVNENELTERPVGTTKSTAPTRRPQRPGAPRTEPPMIYTAQEDSGSQDDKVESNFIRPPRPPPRRPMTTTPRPNNRPGELSQCVRAIISCCSASNEVSYACFEQLGCSGAFWDNSPCDSDFARAAIQAALNYYE